MGKQLLVKYALKVNTVLHIKETYSNFSSCKCFCNVIGAMALRAVGVISMLRVYLWVQVETTSGNVVQGCVTWHGQ